MRCFVSSRFTNGLGCASLDSVTVILKKFRSVINVNADLCRGPFLLASGQLVKAPGSYIDTLKGVAGCDSIIRNITLASGNLLVNKRSATFCSGQSFTLPWGKVVTVAGTYYDTVRYRSGCDSLIQVFDLAQQVAINKTSAAVICPGQSFTLPWGQIANTTGSYTNTIKYASGCDSLVTKVDLVVTNVVRRSIKHSICAGQSFTLPSGQTVSSAGMYIDTLRSVIGGCDSIITIITLDITASSNQFQLPNAFTPNGDGANDCFGVTNWGNITDLNFSIYNRAGNLILQSKNSSECWDGNFKGIPQPAGTYIYKISGTTICGFVKRSGTVELLR